MTISVGPTSVSFIKLRIESNYFFPNRNDLDESRELDACVARKVPASLSLVHQLFHEANSYDRCRLRQSIIRVSVFLDIEGTQHKLIAESV